jgi:hypothetical protein
MSNNMREAMKELLYSKRSPHIQDIVVYFSNPPIKDDIIDPKQETLTRFAMTVLVCDLLNNNCLSLDQQNRAWIIRIFNELGDDKDQLVADYNRIRQSPFMDKMREEYLDKNNEFKEGLSPDIVMQEMFSLKHQKLEGWKQFCDFFINLYNYIASSLKQEYEIHTYKEAHDRAIEANENYSWIKFKEQIQQAIVKQL